MKKQALTTALNQIKQTTHFQHFPVFLSSKMGVSLTAEDTDELEQRRKAYKIFRERTGREEIASLPTMKRWFGIGGNATPDREQIYQMCFAMELSAEETQEYLLYGIHEPAFQVNDYQEVILVYGLYNHYRFDECMEMIRELEIQMEPELELVQTCGSQMLQEEFQGHKDLPWKLFMEWMLERSAYFKGYSKTTLTYFEKYKKLILDYVRSDAREELSRLLTETDYEHWCKMHLFVSANQETKVRKWLASHSQKRKLSEDLQKNIRETLMMAYTPVDANTRLLAEVYGTGKKKLSKNNWEFPTISVMTEKRLSDLLNVPIQKERFTQVQRAWQMLSDEEDNLPCPEWVQKMGQEYPRKAQTLNTVAEAKTWLEKYQRENKRRCLQIRRNDLLPMILYVAQRRYLESIGYENRYEKAAALNQFEQLADSTLAACNMSKLSEHYELDSLLRLCYQEDDFFSYSELLEVM